MRARTENAADSEIACAKINLALHVRKRLPDGYHDIETIFAFLNCGDRISVEPGAGIDLSITGPFAAGLSETDNLVLDAAHLLQSHSNMQSGARITLDKRLPIASGIGGGSADAAATLRLLNRFWETGLSQSELAELSAPLGADLPACVISHTCRGEGIGQDLSPISNDSFTGHFCLLVNPQIPISTASVFEAWDGVDRGALQGDSVMEMAINGRNDLQPPAENIVQAIGHILTELKQTNPVLARMSGSGATCFGLYENEDQAEVARKIINAAFPDAWTMIGGLK